jgi:hypothetical protein
MHTNVCTVQNRTRDLMRSRRVFPPLRQIGRQFRVIYVALMIETDLQDLALPDPALDELGVKTAASVTVAQAEVEGG